MCHHRVRLGESVRAIAKAGEGVTDSQPNPDPDSAERPPARKRFDTTVAWALYGGLVAGTGAFVAGLAATVSNQLLAAGACYLAAGVAFGLVAAALLRR
jgi:hypothetical protein